MINKHLVVAVLLLLAVLVLADESTHKYDLGEPVVVWVGSVGPIHNPLETYSYYELPFCRPDTLETKSLSLGEAVQGLEQVKTNMEIAFKKNVFKKTLCPVKLTEENMQKFLYAIQQQYWHQLFIDELPMWEMIGGIAKEGSRGVPFLYSHKQFSIAYNQDQIVEVNVTALNPVPLNPNSIVTFTYGVNWIASNAEFRGRFKRYLDYNFFEHKIHWFSIFNSFLLVIFLAVVVFMILIRTLRSDLAKQKDAEEGYDSDSEFTDEGGWKQLRGDVFRAPGALELLSSFLGTGWQLAVMMLELIIISMTFNTYEEHARGTLVTLFIVLYSISSFISGYVSGSYYMKHNGKHWIRGMLLTACLFPGACFATGSILNLIAIGYGSAAAIPFGTMIAVVSMWCLITVPLVFVGTIVGRSFGGKADFPCRVNQIAKPIPLKPWYLQRWAFIVIGGVLPFGSIFIEMYFVFTSFWNYKFYYVYGFMLLVYVILIIVTICVSIVSTYFLLNSEDHRWPWTSFLSAASTALYVFIYAIYFFYFKTKMRGLFQTMFYFGYTFMFCFGLFAVTGTIGFAAANIFVSRIYRAVKAD